jgi:predicted NUDIX family phosphoesterase
MPWRVGVQPPSNHKHPPLRTRANVEEKVILAIPADVFRETQHTAQASSFLQLDLPWLFENCISRYRSEIEEDCNFIQLVGLFHVVYRDEILVYLRSDVLAERRLRGKLSINFGGHLQRPSTVGKSFDENAVLNRELFDELDFCGDPIRTDYLGCLYNRDTEFSSRHIGICIKVTPTTRRFRSRETHLQLRVHYEKIEAVETSLGDYDDWSAAVLSRSAIV